MLPRLDSWCRAFGSRFLVDAGQQLDETRQIARRLGRLMLVERKAAQALYLGGQIGDEAGLGSGQGLLSSNSVNCCQN